MLTFKGKDQNGTVWDIVICGNKIVAEREESKFKWFFTTSFENMQRMDDKLGNEILQNLHSTYMKHLIVPQGTFMEILHGCIGFGNQKN